MINVLFFGHTTQHAGILVPQPGIKPVPSAILITGLPGNSLMISFISNVHFYLDLAKSLSFFKEHNLFFQWWWCTFSFWGGFTLLYSFDPCNYNIDCWFSDFSMHENYLESLLKYYFLFSKPKTGPEICISDKVSRFRDHTMRTT